jgi:(2Fe-2S) ferredoxin
VLGWLRRWIDERKSSVPAPPFKASKRTATILYGVWYGRLTPDEARRRAREWGFDEATIEEMIRKATQPPSYWARHRNPDPSLPPARVHRR